LPGGQAPRDTVAGDQNRLRNGRKVNFTILADKRKLGTRAPMAMLQGPNQRWSLDFIADQFVGGWRFRVLVVVDDFSGTAAARVLAVAVTGDKVGCRNLTTDGFSPSHARFEDRG
jgi:transposase InsO family protein